MTLAIKIIFFIEDIKYYQNKNVCDLKIISHKKLHDDENNENSHKTNQAKPEQWFIANRKFWDCKFVDNPLQNQHERNEYE